MDRLKPSAIARLLVADYAGAQAYAQRNFKNAGDVDLIEMGMVPFSYQSASLNRPTGEPGTTEWIERMSAFAQDLETEGL